MSSVRKSFPGVTREMPPVPVIRGVSLSVARGEMVSIVGPSGSGKSTLLYLLSGLEPYDAGTVHILGRDIGQLKREPMAKLRREHVGFVFQSFNLLPSLTVRENVALPARLSKRGVTAAKIEKSLADVGLRERSRHKPGQLSGGQQQRVAIARVLAMEPDVVFADEPTGSLDSASGSEVLRLLRAAASGTRSVVMVTHDLAAAALADRVLVLSDGQIHTVLVEPSTEQVFAAVTSASGASV